MALIKYIGKQPTVITIDGKAMRINPNKMFNGPKELGNEEGFMVLGLKKSEKKLKDKGLKFEVMSAYNPKFDLDFLDRHGKPKVSICIVSKDCNEIVQRCINSIGDFVEYEDIEILICDTGTTDKEVLNYYDFLCQDPRVQLFTGHEYNFSKNNNFLAEKATGDLLLFLNNDVFMTYDAVTEMVKYCMISNVGCVGHRLVWDDDRELIQHDGQVLYDPLGNWRGPHHHNYKVNINKIGNNNHKVEGVTAACLMMRKDLFFEAGQFDEEYKDILQDVALNLNVYKLGYENVVIRKEALIHVDHGSRKTDGTADSPADIMKFRREWTTEKFPVREKVDTSILICATNKKQMNNLRKSLKTKNPYEIVFMNNTKNICFSAESLNKLTDVSEGEYILYTHQDITFDESEPISKIKDIFAKLDPGTGIIGPVGVSSDRKNLHKGIRGFDFSSSTTNTLESLKVQCLDEYCLITKRSNDLRFGEYLDHFHFYGADICCSAMAKGLRNYTVNIKIKHHSGGDSNLKRKDGYEQYVLQARKFYRRWGQTFPKIATTTAHFMNGSLYYYLGHLLGLTPYQETIHINGDPSKDPKLNIEIEEKANCYEYFRFGEAGCSIVILNKDKPEYIKKCIKGITDNVEGKYEVIIGDTGTTNEEVLSFYKTLPDNVKVINVGEYHFSKNNNYLAKNYAHFNRVLFMNNDVFINNDIVAQMNGCWVPSTGVVGLRLLYEDGTIQHDGIDMVISEERNPHKYYLPEHVGVKDKPTKKSNRKVDCVTGACLMMPTKLFNDKGGFDEGYGKVFQDVDLCLKMSTFGYNTTVCSSTWAYHVESGTRDPEINGEDYQLMVGRWGRK